MVVRERRNKRKTSRKTRYNTRRQNPVRKQQSKRQTKRRRKTNKMNRKRGKRSYKKYSRERIIQDGGMLSCARPAKKPEDQETREERRKIQDEQARDDDRRLALKPKPGWAGSMERNPDADKRTPVKPRKKKKNVVAPVPVPPIGTTFFTSASTENAYATQVNRSQSQMPGATARRYSQRSTRQSPPPESTNSKPYRQRRLELEAKRRLKAPI
ncbi:MAG: hypothetical protein CMK44_08210 [Porticoccus sp.]|nr:hypothetical protein [Porticoccus sp.]|tara:strand:+ start:693 stop:1331 length:639 start_codon:yes stop_codon:yes gene_type:complete